MHFTERMENPVAVSNGQEIEEYLQTRRGMVLTILTAPVTGAVGVAGPAFRSGHPWKTATEIL
jgi:hypothetical protein